MRRVSVRIAVPLVAAAAAVTVAASTAGAASVQPNVSPTAATSWQVVAPNWTHANKEVGRVDDLVRIGKHVYIGGDFTEMANHAGHSVVRNHLAAVTPGGNILPFRPNVNGRVYALAASPNGKYLYVGGQFTAINGVPRHNVAAFSVKTGKLSPIVGDLKINGQVRGIAATPSGLYIGGSFGSVLGKPRGKLVKFALTKHGFRMTSWAPTANGAVRDLVVDRHAGHVIVGGEFTSINGSKQPYLASITRQRGKVFAWASHPTADILDISLDHSVLYAAEGGPGGTALSYNVKTGAQRWYYKTDGNVQAVTTVGGYPVFGMHGDNVAPRRNTAMSEYGKSSRVERKKLFMLSPSGVLTSWNPGLSSTAGVLGVWALKNGKGSVYVGGDFTGVHGHPQQRFAILKGR
jgi:trimeric autotransporter adhesin